MFVCIGIHIHIDCLLGGELGEIYCLTFRSGCLFIERARIVHFPVGSRCKAKERLNMLETPVGIN